MLESLTIRNYALIRSLDVDFARGLTVLSGETGAGKSILIGALSLLLGEKGDSDVIRTGSDEAEVSAFIRVDGCQDALEWLSQREIEPEDGSILLRRLIRKSGRGSAYIQSVPATRKDLQDLTGYLFDLHGQHEHQSLFSIDMHRRLLDRFGNTEALNLQVGTLFSHIASLRRELEELRQNERELLRQKDLLEFAIREIDQAGLKEEEEEELEKERRLLNQGEKLFLLLDRCHDLLAEARGGALANLREAMQSAAELAGIDETLEAQRQRIENAFYELEDVDEILSHHLHGVDFSPQRLDGCEERLQQIHKLEKKYGSTISEVIEYRNQAMEKLEHYESREERSEQLQNRIREEEQELMADAKELSKGRREAAVKLQETIREALSALGMPKVRFTISSTYREGRNGKPSCGPNGFDRIEFLISPNAGEPERPLKDIASGGELSRVMLAIKSALAGNDQVETLIFDEIDTGIGGEVAVAVAEYLARLGAKKQVLCITHLASIAVRADNHIVVEKREQDGRSETRIRLIEDRDRAPEIARMLSGTSGGDASLEHARRLLEQAGHV